MTGRAMGWGPGGKERDRHDQTDTRSRQGTDVEKTAEAVGRNHQVWWQSCVGTGQSDTG